MVRGSTTKGTSKEVTPSAEPSVPPSFTGHHDHSFTLQAVMEMQKTIGTLESSMNNLTTQIGSQKTSIDGLKDKIGHIEKIIYAAGILLLIALSLGGWLLTAAKDFAMTYYKASIEAQAKGEQHTPIVPPPVKQAK